jgi:hypothetical protein
VVRFFAVSENSIAVCDPDGIRLYHIPELGSVDDGSILSPVWSWSGESSRYDGNLYDVCTQYPKLYIQGSSVTHKLEFGLNEPGFLVILRYSITRERPAQYIFDGRRFILKGWKGVCHCWDDSPVTILFNTLLLGREHTSGEFRICASELWEEDSDFLVVPEVKHIDLDEVTGRLLVGVDSVARHSGVHARALWLMDPSA